MNESVIASPVLVLVGPTAVGKTALSLKIAEQFGCEIISMDSMQVYRYMDIGTAKASREEQGRVAHHLIDIVDPDQPYDAACFVRDALAALDMIARRGKIPLITGGTGFYLSSLINGLFKEIKVDPEIRRRLRTRLEQEGREQLYQELAACDRPSAERIHPHDSQRLLRGLEIFQATGVPWSEHLRQQRKNGDHPCFSYLLCLGLECDRQILYDRIKIRTLNMMQDAFAREVEDLLARGYSPELPAMQAIGYRHMLCCLSGEWDRQTATEQLIRDTCRYAKRQMTWFRHQHDIHWHQVIQADAIMAKIDLFLQLRQSPD